MILLKIIKAMFLGPSPRLNLIKTLVLNYKLLPIKQAVILPIFMCGRWNLRSLKGRVVIDAENVNTGMFRFGADTTGYFSASISSLSMLHNSTLHISPEVRIGQGVQICMYSNSSLILKRKAALNDFVKVICSSKIEIGESTGITWECQVMDFNSHFILDKQSNHIDNISKPVVIGDYCWVCNRTTIMPGTILPNRVIVASGSLLNRDYCKMGIKERSLIGGTPAKLIKENLYRMYNKDNYTRIKLYFRDNPDASFYEVKQEDNFEE